jgi:hypothetical protein
MRSYILTLATAAICAALCDIIVPPSWKKYIGFATGAMLLISLIKPLNFLSQKELSPILPQDFSYTEYDVSKEVADELKTRVEEDVSARILSEFGISCRAFVELEISDGKIAGVNRIELDTAENERISARLFEVYGCERVIFNG